jgi:DNA-binding MarR family transcriptional regulator
VQNAIRQKKPFRSPASEGVVALLVAGDRLRRRLSEVDEAAGISSQQYNVLRILRGAGAEGIPTLEIAARMIEKTPGITRLLDRLEKKGLVRRHRCTHDRRQVLCWIEKPGLALLDSLEEPLAEAEDAFLAVLSPRALATLVALLNALIAGLEGESPSVPGGHKDPPEPLKKRRKGDDS